MLPAELRNDPVIYLQALRADGHALVYLAEGLRAQKDVVLEAVKQDGLRVRRGQPWVFSVLGAGWDHKKGRQSRIST